MFVNRKNCSIYIRLYELLVLKKYFSIGFQTPKLGCDTISGGGCPIELLSIFLKYLSFEVSAAFSCHNRVTFVSPLSSKEINV